MRRATCPECGRTVNAQGVDGRLVFLAHRVGRKGRGPGNSARCGGSGWLVEDEDLAPPMSAAYAAKSRAQRDLTAARRKNRTRSPLPTSETET